MAEPRRMKTREHGTYAKYVKEGCRCTPCHEEGLRRGRQNRKRLALYGPALIDAGPAREHCARLRAHGMSNAQIAAAASTIATAQGWPPVNRTQIRALLDGQQLANGTIRVSRTLRPTTAAAVRAVRRHQITVPNGALVDGTGTRRRLQALVAIGWPASYLARRLGSSPSSRLQVARAAEVYTGTALAVRALYDELQNTPGPSHRTASAARCKGWLPPGYWDEHTIDDPAYAPPTGEYDDNGTLLWDAALPRQEQIIRLTEQGRSPAQIAEILRIDQARVTRDQSTYRARGLLERAAS